MVGDIVWFIINGYSDILPGTKWLPLLLVLIACYWDWSQPPAGEKGWYIIQIIVHWNSIVFDDYNDQKLHILSDNSYRKSIKWPIDYWWAWHMCILYVVSCLMEYCQTSNVRHTLGNKIVDHSHVVGASPVNQINQSIKSSFVKGAGAHHQNAPCWRRSHALRSGPVRRGRLLSTVFHRWSPQHSILSAGLR